MAVDLLQKQRRRGPGRPFEKGESGNPKGRPAGSRNKATLAAEQVLDSEAAALTRKAVELALGGDALALRLCLDRIIAPRRDRPVELALPAIDNVADLTRAMGAVAAAAARGAVTPGEAAEFAQIVETFVRAIEATDFERRLRIARSRRRRGKMRHAGCGRGALGDHIVNALPLDGGGVGGGDGADRPVRLGCQAAVHPHPGPPHRGRGRGFDERISSRGDRALDALARAQGVDHIEGARTGGGDGGAVGQPDGDGRVRVRRIHRARPGGARRALFERMGFVAVARHRSKNVTLYQPGRRQFHRQRRAGQLRAGLRPAARAVGLRHRLPREGRRARPTSARSSSAPSRSQGKLGPMELNIPAIEGIGGSLIYLVDRYGDHTIYDVDFVPLIRRRAGAAGRRARRDRPPDPQRPSRPHGEVGRVLRAALQFPRDPLFRHRGEADRAQVEGDDQPRRQDPHPDQRKRRRQVADRRISRRPITARASSTSRSATGDIYRTVEALRARGVALHGDARDLLRGGRRRGCPATARTWRGCSATAS